MRTGWKMMVAAAGLMLAGAGNAQEAAAPAAAPTAAVVNSAAPAPAAAATPAAADPALAQDGAYAMSPKPHIGIPTDGAIDLQPQVTKNGQRAHWFHNRILVPVITLISLFVLALLIYAMIAFRRRENREPSKTSHNTFIEVVWTLVPVIILVLIAVPSIGLLSAQFKPAPAGAVTLKAIGNQWYWSYQYPDNGGFEITANLLKECNDPTRDKAARCRTDADGPRLLATDNRVVLPVGVPIRLITTANDVIHSWAVPAFWIKLDAIPGRLNETSFTIEKPGLYFGQCSELCGARHAYMPIAVEAVSPAEFAAWVKAKGGTMGGAPDAGNGQAAPPAAPIGNAADDAAQPGPSTGPVTNTAAAPATTSQPATANPAAVGSVKN
jgi:cytochrome c oxidase subunit 2